MTRGNQREINRIRSTKRQDKRAPGDGNSTLKDQSKNLSIVCDICKQAFMCTTKRPTLEQHVEAKHAKNTFDQCFKNFQDA